MALTVSTLRSLFRNLQWWRALYESDGVESFVGDDGIEYVLWDVLALYARSKDLPQRQREAIEQFLIHNQRERDVAVMMGVSPTNPIGMYATTGLEKLVEVANEEGWFGSTSSDEIASTASREGGGSAECRSCGESWFWANSNGEASRAARQMVEHDCRKGDDLVDATAPGAAQTPRG